MSKMCPKKNAWISEMHKSLHAFIPLLTTPRYIRKNVLHLRRYFCAYFSTWMRGGQVNVNWNRWSCRPDNYMQVKCVVKQRNGPDLMSGSSESEIRPERQDVQ
jgi:hypothetical protein